MSLKPIRMKITQARKMFTPNIIDDANNTPVRLNILEV